MTIPLKTRQLYVECRELSGGAWRYPYWSPANLAALCDALVQAWAKALEAEFHYGHGREHGRCLAGSGYDLDGCSEREKHDWADADWEAEAHRRLSDLEVKDE